jgi:hypothetical protein
MSTLNDAMLSAVDARLVDMHVCLPGRVKKYDYRAQKADVQPLLKRPYVNGAKSLPMITSVPVVWPRGSGGGLNFPLQKDDGVLLVFSERSLDKWLASSGGEADPGDSRRFDLSDAIAVPGLNPFLVPSVAEDGNSAWFKYKDTRIQIDADGNLKILSRKDVKVTATGNVSIKGAKVAMGTSSAELVDLVSQLADQLSQLCAKLMASVVPTFIGPQQLTAVTSGQIAQLNVAVTQIKTQLNVIKGSL